jgi:pimeloyl-ACP methyl ester carboxylesterase
VLASITHPVLAMRGDRDAMVTMEETLAAYEALPNASLGILPHTPHPLEKVHTSVLSALLRSFFAANS